MGISRYNKGTTLRVAYTRGSAYSRIIPRIWYTPACLLTSLRRDIYVNTL